MAYKKIDKNDQENFGFSLLPIFSFSRLMFDFPAATWLGRTVYLMSHLFGAVPHFNVIVAMVKHLFFDSVVLQDQKIKDDGKLYQQKGMKIQKDEGEKENNKEVEDIFDWEDHVYRENIAQEAMPIDDFALDQLLQSEVDA